jgi:hypothetical protein
VPTPLPAGHTLADGTVTVGGEPGVMIVPVTLPSPNTSSIPVTITDSAGDVACVLNVPYPVPLVVDDIVAEVGNTILGTQAAPVAAGP